MDFYNQTGKMALGSRLRRLSEWVTEEAAQIYQLYQINFQPRWFPVFYVVSKEGDQPITAIAQEIGHSHVSVSQIVKDLVKNGYVIEKADKKDKRKTLISLSKSGKELAEKIKDQYEDVNKAIEKAMTETDHDLWKALEEWEHLLEQKSLLKRVQEERKERESRKVRISPFSPKYKSAFKSLNEEWISRYFQMEEADYKALDHPEKSILKKGGHIYIALYENEPVGVCALMKKDASCFELAKMAVSPRAQGKNIGFLLGKHVIEQARELGADTVYLESNTLLKPAIQLYYKLGFQKVTGRPSPYKRSNIQMELVL